jgi:hypothetical protein
MSEPFVKAGGWVVAAPDGSIVDIDFWPSYQERLENGDCEE